MKSSPNSPKGLAGMVSREGGVVKEATEGAMVGKVASGKPPRQSSRLAGARGATRSIPHQTCVLQRIASSPERSSPLRRLRPDAPSTCMSPRGAVLSNSVKQRDLC